MRSGYLASDGVGLGDSDRAGNPHDKSEGVRHAGQERTTESVLWEVCEPDYDAGGTAVDVFCCKLRYSWDR